MTLLDTSVLVAALAGTRPLGRELRSVVASGERLGISSIVLYEWLRGPRADTEIAAQEALFPADAAWPFGTAEATVAAHLYRALPRARQRHTDLAVAATALVRGARLWTAHREDFADVPDLVLFDPRG